MADPLYQNYIPIVADIVSGWNEKISLTNDQLAMFVPFCDLYAVFRDEDPTSKPADHADQRMIDAGFNVNLKGWKDELNPVTLVPVFNMHDQQTSYDETAKKLVRSKGPGGIESCEIELDNVDNEMFRINMRISVPSFDEDVTTNRALRRLTLPGTEWLVIYGWARDSSKEGHPFAPIVENVIDLTKAHKGYYRMLHCALLNCDWNYTAARIAEGEIFFRPLNHIAGTVATVDIHKKKIQQLLREEGELRATCKENAPEIFKQLSDIEVSLKKTRPVQQTVGKGKKKVDKEETGYYTLGWVIEAMRQAMDNGIFWKHTIYEEFVDKSRKTKVKTAADNDSKDKPESLPSPAYIPVSVSDLDSQIFDLSTNESILFSVGRALELANQQMVNSISLIVQGQTDGSTIAIRCLNDIAWTVANRTDVIAIDVASPNSLLESIKFGSRVPHDWTYGLNLLVNTNEGATMVYNMFEKDAALDHPTTSTGLLLKKFNKASLGNKEALDTNRLSNWKSYLSKSDSPDKIVSEVLASNTVPIGLALRQFFKSITVTIHGTAMIPPWTQLAIRGMLPGVDGIYMVFRSSDSLTPGNFTSTIEALLMQPF